jgi:GAF domain
MQQGSEEGKRPSLRECGEVVGGVGLLTLGGWFIPLNWAPAQSMFCAFFLVIFAFAIRYRSGSAYGAGLIAVSGYSCLLWWRPDLQGQIRTPCIFEVMLLLATGMLCNGLQQRQRKHLTELQQQNASSQEQALVSTRRYQTLLVVNEELEQRVSRLPTSLAAFCESIEHIWTQSGDARLQAMLKMVLQTIEAQEGALYLLEQGNLQLAGRHRDQGTAENDPFVPARGDPIVRATLQKGQVCTVHDLLGEGRSLDESTAIMAGPLRLRNQQLRGIIVINHMPLLKFSPEAVELFQMVLHIAEIALWNEHEQHEHEDDRVTTNHEFMIVPVSEGLRRELERRIVPSIDGHADQR